MEKLAALKALTHEIKNLHHASSILGWDQQTNMPRAATAARASQIATLSKIAHQQLVSEEARSLLEDAAREVAELDPDSDDRRLVEVVQRDYDNAIRLPADFVAEFSRQTSLAHEVWAKARSENHFPTFQPMLEKLFDLARQKAEYLGYEDHIYDALLDQFEPGATTAHVSQLFDGLRKELVPFVKALYERSEVDGNEPLLRHFPVDQQEKFGLKVVSEIGYNLSRGRQDEVVHPFCTSFSIYDVRITTRFNPNFLSPALFGTIHEAGHATYEQGISPELEGTLLCRGTSLGVHESQSRLWENMVGRSYGFWQHYYPALQKHFPGVLDDVDLERFYRAINHVSPSFIRVEADEVSYPLHIMLRFEIEQEILTGQLKIADAPDAWNAKFESYFGVLPPDDAHGILQDVHWSMGIMGYFPTYALGTLLSAQLYNHAVNDHPEIPDNIQHGKFDTLLHWMNTKIHQHGRKFKPAELVQRAIGEDLGYKAYMEYVREKYGAIYGL